MERSTGLKRIVINTFLLILEQLNGFYPQLLPRDSFDIFMKSLGFASRFLALLAKTPPGYPGREDLPHADSLAIPKFIGMMQRDIIYDLVVVLPCIPLLQNNQDKQQMEENLSSYIRNYFAERKCTVLHVAVTGEMTETIELIKLLIKLGTDNAID
ncbi:hypothetical protein DAPPUDRAFT_318970 [Daphnia pulex]|uniref:Uncharacterized protein n=1 Tax=Daphnia pulex TaxID=6669 RepID=E9GKA4_DAPPU|nr:hypothetical protein DAPPUDRAFT_318970 [Daphnia pulex]|eukprot:EFX80093.1 hypothetical protein DAPPUDRAFT_318970 [Daphnia pulex]